MSHRFQVDLRGLIDLLSNHLYSRADVFVRELLQNAVDARTALRIAGVEGSDRPGVVRFDVSEPGVLVVRDDGVGLEEDEVHTFLATIGQSSKRLAEGTARDDFLGQFGIGLLACFVVSESIVVRTRSARRPDAKTLRWAARDDGTYALAEDEEPLESPGTEVRLEAKPEALERFGHEAIRASLRRYGRFLPHRIELAGPRGVTRLDETAPWAREQFDRAAAIELGEEWFGEHFIDAVPLESAAGEVRGVALILDRASAVDARRADVAFLKGMLLSDGVERLLPSWAFFVRAIVDTRGLRPVASREAFVEDAELAAARRALGACLRDYLLGLARDDEPTLQRLIGLHHGSLKLMAVTDRELLQILGPSFPFETSAGTMPLVRFMRGEATIRYAETLDQFRQVAPLVEADGRPVINAAFGYDREILRQLDGLPGFPPLERVDASSLTDSFAELGLDERAHVAELVEAADAALRPFRCGVSVRRFEPARLPAVYVASDDATFVRDLERSKEATSPVFAGLLGDVGAGREAHAQARLVLNFESPLVRRLAGVDDAELLRRLVEVLYVQTLLLGHYPLSASEMGLLSGSVTGLIEWSLEARARTLQ